MKLHTELQERIMGIRCPDKQTDTQRIDKWDIKMEREIKKMYRGMQRKMDISLVQYRDI